MNLGRATAYRSRNRHKERRSLVRFGFGPDAAAVPVQDALGDGKSHARAFKFLPRVQALKYSEQLVRVAHVESRSIVGHEENRLAVHFSYANFNRRFLSAARKF